MRDLHEDGETREIVLDLPSDAISVTRARQWAVAIAGSWGLDGAQIDRLAVAVTELASNAVVHARSPFRLRLLNDDGTLRGELADTSPVLPRVLKASPWATAGRGLMLVRALTDRAGVEDAGTGKFVWFELDSSA